MGRKKYILWFLFSRVLQRRFHKCIEKNTWRCIGGGYILHLSWKKLFACELSELFFFFLSVWKQCSTSETWLNKELMWVLLALKNNWSTVSLLNKCLFLVAVSQQTHVSQAICSPHCFKFSRSSLQWRSNQWLFWNVSQKQLDWSWFGFVQAGIF